MRQQISAGADSQVISAFRTGAFVILNSRGDNREMASGNGTAEWHEETVRVDDLDLVVVKGWPWRQTVCIRGHDYLRSSERELVYENRYVIWGEMKWGKLIKFGGIKPE